MDPEAYQSILLSLYFSQKGYIFNMDYLQGISILNMEVLSYLSSGSHIHRLRTIYFKDELQDVRLLFQSVNQSYIQFFIFQSKSFLFIQHLCKLYIEEKLKSSPACNTVSPIENDYDATEFNMLSILLFAHICIYSGDRQVIYLSLMVFWRLLYQLGQDKQTATLICPASLTNILCGLMSPTFLFKQSKSLAVLTKVYIKYHIYYQDKCLFRELLLVSYYQKTKGQLSQVIQICVCIYLDDASVLGAEPLHFEGMVEREQDVLFIERVSFLQIRLPSIVVIKSAPDLNSNLIRTHNFDSLKPLMLNFKLFRIRRIRCAHFIIKIKYQDLPLVLILRLQTLQYSQGQISSQNKIFISMGSYLFSGVFCCLECCCRDVLQALKRLLGNQRVTKLFYIFLVVFFVVPGIFLFFFLNKYQSFVDYFSKWFSCPADSDGGTFECFGASAVYRLSLSLLCMFFILMLLMVCRNRCSMVINQGLFFIKYVFVVGLFVGSLWVPNTTFIDYAEASKYLSIAFMVLQAIILIDLFYMAGIRMVKHYDQGQTQYACYLIFLSVVFEGVAVGLNVLGYIQFASKGQSCQSILWVNILNTIILVVLPVLQFFNWNVQNSLLTTCLVSMYVSYLTLFSQYSYKDPNIECSKMSAQSLIADVIVSTFFFVLTMYGSITGGSGQVKVTQNGDINKAMGIAPQTEGNSQEQKDNNSLREQLQLEKQQKTPTTYEDWTWVKWHFYLCLSSMYVGMLITNWGSANLTTNSLEPSSFGFWVRIGMAWTSTLLYIWTLIAPKVFPQRDFIVQ